MRLIRALSHALTETQSAMLRIVVAGLLIGCIGAAAAKADNHTTWFLTWNCGHGYLDTHCTQIADPSLRSLLNALGDFQMVNLIFRFMAFVGFSLDLLAGWYLVYVWNEWVRRRPEKLHV